MIASHQSSGAAGHATTPKGRAHWSDRFQVPTPRKLTDALPPAALPVFLHARNTLKSLFHATECIAWQGVWCWTFTYRIHGSSHPVAYLVPDPTRPRLCVPIEDSVIIDLPLKKLSRAVRDGLAHSPLVSGIRWTQWELLNLTTLDEVFAIVRGDIGMIETPETNVQGLMGKNSNKQPQVVVLTGATPAKSVAPTSKEERQGDRAKPSKGSASTRSAKASSSPVRKTAKVGSPKPRH